VAEAEDPAQNEPLGPAEELNVLLQQWISVRQQGDGGLSGQLSALSLGIAAISVLIAAVGAIWTKAPLAACAGLMAVVPPVADFVLLVWATEIKKTLRASSFLRLVAEPRVNTTPARASHRMAVEHVVARHIRDRRPNASDPVRAIHRV
jgi:hypothetical protein